MPELWLPILHTLLVWWFSTGAILYLDGLPRRTFAWSMLGATAILGMALWGLAASSTDASVGGAYVAFTCGLLVWAWQEMSFLMGFVTGPRTTACPEGSRGWRRFGFAVQACLYHELAIAASAAAVVAVTWGEPNQVGTWTFLVLWAMRVSAKLNVFLGVRNLTLEWLPDHLAYLASYLSRRPMNLLFPLSVTASTVALVALVGRASAPGADGFDAVGSTFLATLVALGLLEHWFLVLPLPFAALWDWGLKSRAGRAEPPETPPMNARASAHWRCP